MSIGITIFRWSTLLAGIVLCLIYLNGAAYCAWVAGGPPTSNSEGWLFSAGNHLSWALAFLGAGIGLFILIGKQPGFSISLAFLFLSLALATLPVAREFLATDSCLDAGGKWSASELRCVYE